MSNPDVFGNVTVIGELPPDAAVAKLREMGEYDLADEIEEQRQQGGQTYGTPRFWPFQPPIWKSTAHSFGYIAPFTPGSSQMQTITYAGNIQPDTSLKNSRIKITLDRLRVAKYPGGGTHQVLFDFYAQNQVSGTTEKLHFNATYPVREGEQAGITGFPVFVGLSVGSDGVAFACVTVNVQNDDDKKFIGFLNSDVFKSGLKLVEAAQPAIAPLSQFALSITESIANRNNNVGVQKFDLGLDFGNVPTRARLAIGSYIAVQIAETMQTVWDWTQWVYNPNNGQLTSKADPSKLIPYNYVVFGVDRYEGE